MKRSSLVKRTLLWIAGAYLFVFALQELVIFQIESRKNKAARQQIQTRSEIAKTRGANFDARSPFEVAKAYQKSGKSAFPLVVPRYFLHRDLKQPLPLSGLANRSTVFCNESGRYVTYESDEQGFRNPKGLVSQPAEILLIGDSLAHGACVDEDLATLLRKKNRNVVNLGTARNGPLLNLATLVEYGHEVRPKQVFWLYSPKNDMDELADESFDPRLAHYVAGKPLGIRKQKAEIDRYVEAIATRELERVAQGKPPELNLETRQLKQPVAILDRLSIGPLRKLVSRKPGDVPVNESRRYGLQAVLRAGKRHVKQWGGEVTLVYMPTRATIEDPKGALREKRAAQRAARGAGLRFLDATPAIQDAADPKTLFPFQMAGHYTQEGYQRVADLLDRHLSARSTRTLSE